MQKKMQKKEKKIKCGVCMEKSYALCVCPRFCVASGVTQYASVLAPPFPYTTHAEFCLGYLGDANFYLESKASFIDICIIASFKLFLIAWLREYCTNS